MFGTINKIYQNVYNVCYGFSNLSLEQIAINIARQYGGSLLYAKSNLSNLWQNSNGTGAVTTTGQPVGLWLDQSFNGELGAELVANGDFSNGTTGWTPSGGATLSINSGRLRVQNTGGGFGFARQTITTVIGRSYLVTADLFNGTASGLLRPAGQTPNDIVLPNNRVIFVATSTSSTIDLYVNSSTLGLNAEFDNISVREVLGFHATQATGVNKPLTTTINGNFAVSSDGTNDFMSITPPAITNACTIVWAGRVNNLTVSQKLFVGATNGLDITINTNGSITLSKVGASTIGTTATGVVVASGLAVYSFRLNAGTWTVRKNGTVISTFTDAQTFTATTYTLFATSAGANPLNAITAECFIDNQSVPDADLLQIERFGAQQMGISSFFLTWNDALAWNDSEVWRD